MKYSIPLLAAGLSLCIVAPLPAFAAGSDSQTSAENPKLSCTLSVSQQSGKAEVSWTITGGTAAAIDPLVFANDKVPLQGSQTIDFSGVVHVFLVVRDAEGHWVRCHAGAGGNVFTVSGSTGSGPGAPEPVIPD